jgi:chloramphenicol 3-O phosphotransferase
LNTTAKIILLNGVGSAGKSTIARALQAVTIEPFLHVQLDTFMDMLTDAYQQHPDGFTYKTTHEAGKPLVAIETGRAGARASLLSSMRIKC